MNMFTTFSSSQKVLLSICWSKLTLDITLGLVTRIIYQLECQGEAWGEVKESFPILSISYPFTLCHSQFILLIFIQRAMKNAASDLPLHILEPLLALTVPRKINPGPKHRKQQKFYCANRSSTIYLLPDARVFFNPYILSKEKNWPGIWVSLCLICEDFQSSAFLGLHGHIWHLQVGILCAAFSSNKLLWTLSFDTPSLIENWRDYF